MPENLDLPFDYHYAEGDGSQPPCVIVWTTTGPEDADTVDHVAVVDVPEDDPNGERSLRIAEFVTKALNHYTNTPEGLDEWRKIHPLLPLQVNP